MLFGTIGEETLGPLHLHVPDPASLRPDALALAAVAFVLLFALHRSIAETLAVCGGLSLLWWYTSR